MNKTKTMKYLITLSLFFIGLIGNAQTDYTWIFTPVNGQVSIKQVDSTAYPYTTKDWGIFDTTQVQTFHYNRKSDLMKRLAAIRADAMYREFDALKLDGALTTFGINTFNQEAKSQLASQLEGTYTYTVYNPNTGVVITQVQVTLSNWEIRLQNNNKVADVQPLSHNYLIATLTGSGEILELFGQVTGEYIGRNQAQRIVTLTK